MRLYLAMLFCALIVAGCSQSGGSPVSPSNSASFDEISVIGLTESGDMLSAVGLMGVYELTVNPETMELDLVSKRSSTIGESYIVSGVGFWTMAPCPNCLGIKSYSLGPNDELVITFTSDHPFPAGNPGLPPTAANRLDLDVFDLAALIMPVSGATSATNFPLTGSSAYVNIGVDPDGYTRELENVTGERAAVPYFLVVDESGSSSPKYNKYAMGTTNKEFDVRLNIAGGAVPAFDIYLTMGYGASAKKATRLTPKYYNPEFNRKRAWKVEVTPPVGGWYDNDSTTALDVIVKVYDWQQGIAVSSIVPYSDEADTTKIYAASDVASVTVEIPGMNSSLPLVTTPTSGTGSTTNPLIFTVPVANELLLPPGEYMSLVKVIDARAAGVSSVGGEVDTLVDTPDGIALIWYSMPEFATYQSFVAEVNMGCGPISGEIVNPELANYKTIKGLADGQKLNITVLATSANASIVQYDADFNYDGINFASDATSTTGVFTNLGPIVVPDPCSSNVPYTFRIAFRATDNCVPPNETIFKIYTGQADVCKFTTPVGNVTITVNRNTSLHPDVAFFDLYGPWTLNWPAVPGAVEYSVYVDTDPGNYALPAWTVASLTDNLILLGSTTTNSYAVPPAHLATNRYTPGNTYVVRGRSAVGVPESECTINSELAFIMTFGFESSGANNLNPEGWVGFNYITGDVSINRNMHTATWRNWGNYSYRWGYQTTAHATNPTNPVVGSTHRTPMGIPNSSRYIDTSINLYQYYTPGGIFFVTSATAPTQGTTDYSMMEHVMATSTGGYYGYNSNQQAAILGYNFVDVPATNQCWIVVSPNKRIVSANFDATGNTSHPFVGIVKVDNSTNYNDYPSMDETAILIY